MNTIQAHAERVGALLRGHFILTSGRHSDTYFNKDALYPDPEAMEAIAEEFAIDLYASGFHRHIDVIVGPEKGGIVLSTQLAGHLHRHNVRTEGHGGQFGADGKPILSVYAEKDGDGMVLKRGYDKLVQGKRCWIVEDVLTTGLSVLKTAKAIERAGGIVVGVSAICNRGRVLPEQVGAPVLRALMTLEATSYAEGELPELLANVPINTEVGKGKEYLAAKTVPQQDGTPA